jgi:hypothetical protein
MEKHINTKINGRDVVIGELKPGFHKVIFLDNYARFYVNTNNETSVEAIIAAISPRVPSLSEVHQPTHEETLKSMGLSEEQWQEALRWAESVREGKVSVPWFNKESE